MQVNRHAKRIGAREGRYIADVGLHFYYAAKGKLIDDSGTSRVLRGAAPTAGSSCLVFGSMMGIPTTFGLGAL